MKQRETKKEGSTELSRNVERSFAGGTLLDIVFRRRRVSQPSLFGLYFWGVANFHFATFPKSLVGLFTTPVSFASHC
jgi:hypothetical protein